MDPVLELQAAMLARMKAYAPLTAMVTAAKIYASVPTNATGTYVSVGPSNVFQDDADCIYSASCMIQIDVWSDAGMGTVRQISDAVRRAFRGYEPTLTTNALVTFEHERTDYLDADGSVQHGSIRFVADIEQP